MAFVSRSAKNVEAARVSESSLGPGSYFAVHEYTYKPGFVPFLSACGRDPVQLGDDIPGPGSYEAPSPQRHPAARRSVPFDSLTSKSVKVVHSAVPGPGSYDLPRSFVPKQKGGWDGLDVTPNRRVLAHHSTPSIPVAAQSFGYEEDNCGNLIRQPHPDSWLSGTPRQSVGPGEYNPVVRVAKERGSKSCCRWVPPVRDRATVSDRQLELPGPGSYVPEAAPCRAECGPSSAFASTTARIVQTHATDQDRSESSVPGPGHYAQTLPTFNTLRGAPGCFGTKATRFRNSLPAATIPGPGAYSFGKLPSTKKKGFGFGGGARFNAQEKKAGGPGPGAYDPLVKKSSESSGGDGGARLGGIGPAFGGTERRFKREEESPQARVGNLEEQSRMAPPPTGPSSVFKSCTSRFQPPPNSPGVVAPGSYDISKTGGVLHVPPTREGFLASAGRFAVSAPHSTPGPASYDMPSAFDERPMRPVATFVSDRTSSAKAPRFGPHKKAPSPGPGWYTAPDSWNKKTFNTLFVPSR